METASGSSDCYGSSTMLSGLAMSCLEAPDTEPPKDMSLLHQRLLLAEKEAEALIRDMDALGAARNQIPGPRESLDGSRRPATPLRPWRAHGDELWQHFDSHSFEGRMNHLESQLQTMKLSIFRFTTEKELDPSNTDRLKQQLAGLRQEAEEEQALRREVKRLREQLQQAWQERDNARTEVHMLGETLEAMTAAKRDVALATEELRIVKLEMSQKLMEMKERMRQESASFQEAMKSHHELLQRTKETERALEMERRQAELLQAACRDLQGEVRDHHHQLEEERDRSAQLAEQLHRLKKETVVKDCLVSELKSDLQRQQSENSKLLNEDRELRAAADRVQTLNKQLQTHSSQLTYALHCFANAKHHYENGADAELQVALSNRDVLMELEKLKEEYAQLLQSSCIAQDTAHAQRELLERTVERLRGELDTATRGEEAARKRLQVSENELCLVVTKLETERKTVENQLGEAKREAASLNSKLNSQLEENRRLMGMLATLEHQRHAVQQMNGILKSQSDGKNKAANGRAKLKGGDLEAQKSVSALSAGDVANQTLDSIVTTHSRAQLDSQMQQQPCEHEQELAALHHERLQAQQEISKHQAEVETLQQLLTSTHLDSNRALQSLQQALNTATVDNKRLTKGLEDAVSTNNSLHSKLEHAREQYKVNVTIRDEQLRQAHSEMHHLSKELNAAKEKTREEQEFSMSALRCEISQLKTAIKASLSGSGDYSKADPELSRRVSKLEKLVSRQGACLREQRSQTGQRKERSQINSQEVKNLEERPVVLQEEKRTDAKLQELNIDAQQELSKHDRDWKRWESTIQRWEAQRELAYAAERTEPATTQLITHR